MKFAFFGTPAFAATVLAKLIAGGFVPETVVANPDRPVGRRKIVTPPPVKQILLEQDESIRERIRLFQPEHSKELPLIPGGPYDFFVVASYGFILPKELLILPRLGTVGVHPSLLPHHRGASPIQTTILEGDREAGVSLFLVDEKVDHGPIIAREMLDDYDVTTMTYRELHDVLAELAGDFLVRTLPRFLEGALTPEAQDESRVTFTKKFTTEDGFVDLEKDEPEMVWRKVRALNPEPGVFTLLAPSGAEGSPSKGGLRRMKILDADYRDGKLILRRTQMEGELPKNASRS
ncbi:MAG: methionyl-tRNA formyltransferase [Candidatus Jorgensenbacteria bacterium]|nr:methionyl-tRNA formyltransferase [Candidatus Jorgensenbacteria bacterium]